jgi:hypothetical protein
MIEIDLQTGTITDRMMAVTSQTLSVADLLFQNNLLLYLIQRVRIW